LRRRFGAPRPPGGHRQPRQPRHPSFFDRPASGRSSPKVEEPAGQSQNSALEDFRFTLTDPRKLVFATSTVPIHWNFLGNQLLKVSFRAQFGPSSRAGGAHHRVRDTVMATDGDGQDPSRFPELTDSEILCSITRTPRPRSQVSPTPSLAGKPLALFLRPGLAAHTTSTRSHAVFTSPPPRRRRERGGPSTVLRLEGPAPPPWPCLLRTPPHHHHHLLCLVTLAAAACLRELTVQQIG
jgi:hypothetical protein